MNRKKLFVTAIAVNTAVLTFAACFYHLVACQAHERGDDLKKTALAGVSGKFGPVIETVLLSGNTNGTTDILDLETGRVLRQESAESFNFRVDAMMAWIRTNGLDISCFVTSSFAACTTYEMNLLPVERKCWDKTTEGELLRNPALAPRTHSPRRQLVLASYRPDTYVFRTGEGTLGMLQFVGLAQDGHGVKIRYKLIAPAKALSAAL
jgi:hypothetical protein